MKLFKIEDLSYNGVKEGVHSWDHPQGDQPYYWHPDWLHVAEDITGLHGRQALDVKEGETANEEHAKQAIVDHLNNKNDAK
ncbi:hypothetical protein L1D54_10400 [Vibrio brasiliensis]|uniref:hypothetical protein n=1 Tax=Vibrio brasiliensis TaxID=170652 RepID=UPI001EFDFB44|nr:hypothetical protein [Vibrio brasiliensis]MCG9725566.1 hypothetical protein [Vibrio brasiliensis]MCG9750890.1 hypothetical protein [Vibrio brasiliensis]MCG9784650.1 hypothetical protein [Vibrio brasiliensis]